MPTIKAILFDKDGTLFGYGRVWGPIMSDYIDRGLEGTGLDEAGRREYKDRLMRAAGFDSEGGTYPDGIIFSHKGFLRSFWRIFRLTVSYGLNPFYVGRLSYRFLRKNGDIVASAINEEHFPDAYPVIRKAYERGYIIGVVTNDTEASASVFMEKMRIRQYISFLRTKDGRTRRKPHPGALREFCREFGLRSEEVAVIGDSLSDMLFARNGKAGYAVAVMTGFGSREELSRYADAIYDDISGLAGDRVLFP